MELKNLLASLLCGMLALYTSAQHTEVKRLIRGEEIPNLSLSIQEGDSLYTKEISSFKGKSILIDIWGVYCLTCLDAMPKLDSLQEKFKDSLVILLLCDDPDEKLAEKIKQWEKKESLHPVLKAMKRLKMIKKDSLLKSLFPHNMQPSHVWIDQKGVFRYLTLGTKTDANVIARFISNKPIEVEHWDNRPLDLENPLQWYEKPWLDNLKYYSIFSSFVNGRSNQIYEVIDSLTQRPVGYHFLNASVLNMYRFIFRNVGLNYSPRYSLFPSNRVFCTGRATELISPSPSDDPNFYEKYTFCYSVKVPQYHANRLDSIMASELDRYFGWRSGIKQVSVECWVLKRASDTAVVLSRDLAELPRENISLRSLIDHLNVLEWIKKNNLPVINDTELNYDYAFQIVDKRTLPELSASQLQKILRRNGLILEKECRLLDMLVFENQ